MGKKYAQIISVLIVLLLGANVQTSFASDNIAKFYDENGNQWDFETDSGFSETYEEYVNPNNYIQSVKFYKNGQVSYAPESIQKLALSWVAHYFDVQVAPIGSVPSEIWLSDERYWVMDCWESLSVACQAAKTDFDESERQKIYEELIYNAITSADIPSLLGTEYVKITDGSELFASSLSNDMVDGLKAIGFAGQIGLKGKDYLEKAIEILSDNPYIELPKNADKVAKLAKLMKYAGKISDSSVNAYQYIAIREYLASSEKISNRIELVLDVKAYAQSLNVADNAFCDAVDNVIYRIENEEINFVSNLANKLSILGVDTFTEEIVDLITDKKFVLSTLKQMEKVLHVSEKMSDQVSKKIASGIASGITAGLEAHKLYAITTETWRRVFISYTLNQLFNEYRYSDSYKSLYVIDSNDYVLNDSLHNEIRSSYHDLVLSLSKAYYDSILILVDNQWNDFVVELVDNSLSTISEPQLYALHFAPSAIKFGSEASKQLVRLGQSDEISAAKDDVQNIINKSSTRGKALSHWSSLLAEYEINNAPAENDLTNNLPVAIIRCNYYTTNISTQIQVDGSSSYDPDGDPIADYEWQLSKPQGSGASLSGAGSSITFVPDIVGAYTINLVVSDGVGTSIKAQSTINATYTYDVSPITLPEQYLLGSASTGSSGPENWTNAWSFTVSENIESIYVVRFGGSSTSSLGIAVRKGSAPTVEEHPYSPDDYIWDDTDYEGVLDGQVREEININNPSSGVYYLRAYAFGDGFSSARIYYQLKENADFDDDGVPNDVDEFPNDEDEQYDSDDDGVGDNADKFPNDVAASIDTDNDGFPDSWNTGKSQADSTTMLTLDVFPNDPYEWADSDNDGIGDNSDTVDENFAPVAIVVTSNLNVDVDTPVSLDAATSYDPDGDSIVSYSWSLISPSDSSSVLSSHKGESVAFTPDVEGKYTVVLNVSDGESTSQTSVEVAATKTYAQDELVVLEEGKIYIEDIGVEPCTIDNVQIVTIPDGEIWSEVRFVYSSPRDLIILASVGEWPGFRSGDEDKCSNGYMPRFDADFKHDFYDDGSGFDHEWSRKFYPGDRIYISLFSFDGYTASYGINGNVEVDKDQDNDGVPDEKDAFPNNASEQYDSDNDGYGDNADQFDNDPAAYLDSDEDGYPDSWISGKTQSDSTLGLTLDAFPNDSSEGLDSDNDGVGNNDDKFDEDSSASADSDGDAYPDEWNDGKSESDSTTGLRLDKFPTDPAAAVDDDGDGYPDYWNTGKTATDSTTGLTLDWFSDDGSEWADSDHDGVGDNSDWAPEDYTEWADSDGDDVGDNADAAPDDPNRQTNSVPVIVTIENHSMDAGSSRTLTVSVSDDDGDLITLQLVSAPSFVELNGGQLVISPSASDAGTYQVILKAVDGFGGKDSATFMIEVVASVTPNAGDDQSVNEHTMVTLNASASTASGGKQIVSYLWEQTDGTAVTIGNAYASATTFTAPDVDKNGDTLTFRLTLEDNDGESYTDTCTVEILWVNIAPVSNAGADQVVDEGEMVSLNGTNSTGVDDEIVSWQWAQVSGTPVDISNGTTATASFTAPDVDENGETLEFALTVTDSGGLSATANCLVQLTWVNIPPVADAGPNQTVQEGQVVFLNGGNSTDSDDGLASWQWEIIGRPDIVLNNGDTSTASFTSPDVLMDGAALSCRLTVTDTAGLRDTDMCIVNVSWVNEPPHADAGPAQTAIVGDTVVLDGSNSTDSDDGIAHYLWSQTSGTAVTLSDVTSQNPLFTAPDINEDGAALTFELKVTDTAGLEDTENCIVNVFGENDPPIAHAGNDMSVMEGTVVELDGSYSSDPDDGIASYRWTQQNGIAVTLDDPTAIMPRFTSPDVGPEGASLEFVLTVTDGAGNKSTDSCVVNVTWENIPPVADAGPDQSVMESHTVTLNGSASMDSDDGITTYSWRQTAGPSVTLSEPEAARPRFVAPPVTSTASISFVLTVEDAGGLRGTDQVDITVFSNGISGYDDTCHAVQSSTGKTFGIKAEDDGDIVLLKPVNPDDIPESSLKPQNLVYGLLDIEVKVTKPGNQATVVIIFPEPVPSGFSWVKYSEKDGWTDYSDHAVFSENRDRVTITLVDGGIGDDDGVANGIIHDPSGVGNLNVVKEGSDDDDGGGGGGGCFINSLF
ncbi:hypothetical protein JCM14469_41980 [Desulfatiferula olefinivorans]